MQMLYIDFKPFDRKDKNKKRIEKIERFLNNIDLLGKEEIEKKN